MSTNSFVHVLRIEVEKGTVVVVLCAEAAFGNAHTTTAHRIPIERAILVAIILNISSECAGEKRDTG